MSGHVASARPAPPRDFDGIFKALLNAHPRDALQVLCGATLRDGDVVTAEPTEQPRQRSRQCDTAFAIRHDDGSPTDVYQIEVQVNAPKTSRNAWCPTGRPWQPGTGAPPTASTRWSSGRKVTAIRAVSNAIRCGSTTTP
ncbi:hypothetical protein [Actinoplanes subtropicus]|uniref:hypothetical protein n=1 Tax=Actinoplanes subtropicus TaxID=543632 RepID=UPI00146FE54B|nr:hypothetical protein [Actinoplanes subtropicus]